MEGIITKTIKRERRYGRSLNSDTFQTKEEGVKNENCKTKGGPDVRKIPTPSRHIVVSHLLGVIGNENGKIEKGAPGVR